MNEQIKDNFLKIAFLWIIVSAIITIPASCGKAVQAFYHQVILKDQIVGQPRVY